MMQNQNVHPWPWGQGSAPQFQASQNILPSPFSSGGVDQNSLVPGFQLYGNSPVQSTDFAQWNSTHLQQWQQWQQWQEKYQQWQIQYGKKYAESLVATGQNPSALFPNLNIPQSFFKSDKCDAFESSTPAPVPAPSSNPPLPPNSLPPPPPPDEEKPPLPVSERKDGQEELSDAEKTFDIQFKQWEGQFNAWKKENQDHPDKVQYKEYEKKWEAWREQLLQRREQMRKKRLSQTTERKSEQNNSGTARNDEEKKLLQPGGSIKPSGSEYGYTSRSLPLKNFLPDDSKFENNQSSSSQLNNNRSGFCSIPENSLVGRTPHGNGKNFPGPGGSYFSGYAKTQNQAPGFRFRNQNNTEGFRSGRFENYPRKPKPRSEDSFSPSYRLGCEGKSEGNAAGQQSSSNMFFEKESGGFNLRESEGEDVGSENERNFTPETNVLRNFSGNKSKVPSLFDITVEKPSGFRDSSFDRRHDARDKMDKNSYFDKKRKEREETNNFSSNFQSKTSSSPRMQPWEDAGKKMHERTFGLFKSNSNWVKNSEQQRVDKSELSGYVGNILAKLGQCNVLDSERGFASSGSQPNFDKEIDFCAGESFYKTNECSVENVEDQVEDADLSKDGTNSKPEDADRKVDCDDVISDYEKRELLQYGGKQMSECDSVDEEGPNSSIKDDFKRVQKPFGRNEPVNSKKDFPISGKNDRGMFGRGLNIDPGYRGLGDNRFPPNRMERRKLNEREEKTIFERKGGGRVGFSTRDREPVPGEPVWKPQVFDYSQGRPLRISDPDEEFKISTVVDYSHGENMQSFEYRHGEGRTPRVDTKYFDYGHRTESPTVIDYGHGVDNTSSSTGFGKEEVRENGRNAEGKMEDSVAYRPRSRSPHLKYKRRSPSPSFKGDRARGKDSAGRQLMMMRRSRKNSDDKSLGEGEVSKASFDVTTVLVEDLICRPGRETRPNKLVFIMRGLPGSGKTYVTKLIKDKEIESGGDPPRILSLDDYFMTEVEKEVRDKETGRKMKCKVLEYEYEVGMESYYKGSLTKAFKKTVSDGFFSFVIVDSVNEKTKDYEEMWSFAKQKGFQVYVAEMDNDVAVCTARNIHKRTEKEVLELSKVWEETPSHYLRLDVRSLLQSDAITEVEMEVVSDTELEKTVGKQGESEISLDNSEGSDGSDDNNREEEDEEEPRASKSLEKSRWDHLENSEQNLDRLDGLKRRREGFHETMEDYLQLPEDLGEVTSDSTSGKKRVRWADLEERRQQEKMRAIGFVVGQTDWNRMTDPTFGESALTRTKYI